MKKTLKVLLIFSIIILTCGIMYLSYLSVVDMNENNNETDVKGKDISKEEYIYKEDLLELGYTVNDIKIIETKISTTNVKKYLLNNKYDNLTKFVYSPYFNIENISRYENYFTKNNFSSDDTVLYVEIGLDKEFYTDITVIENYNDEDALVNKYNKLPSNITYDDLVTVEKPYSDNGKRKLRKVAYEHFVEMANAAKKDNIKLYVVSGYRTEKQQNSLFNNNVKRNGIEHALIYSAKVNHSEHQLGLAIDINSVNVKFEKTKEYTWLKENSYKYGFIERYPKNKEFITGYGYEPWHYRYLGIDIATTMYEKNITYEEYLVKYKSNSY